MGWLWCIFFIKFFSLSLSLILWSSSIVCEFHLQIVFFLSTEWFFYFAIPYSRPGNVTVDQLNADISSPLTLPGVGGCPCSPWVESTYHISISSLSSSSSSSSSSLLLRTHLVNGRVRSLRVIAYHQYSSRRSSRQRNERSSRYI